MGHLPYRQISECISSKCAKIWRCEQWWFSLALKLLSLSTESMPKSLLVLSHLSPSCGLCGEGGGQRDLFCNSSKLLFFFFPVIEGKSLEYARLWKNTHSFICPACHFDLLFHSKFEGIPFSVLCSFPISLDFAFFPFIIYWIHFFCTKDNLCSTVKGRTLSYSKNNERKNKVSKMTNNFELILHS